MGNCLPPFTGKLATIPGTSEQGVKVFTMAELKKATNNFGKEMVIAKSSGALVRGYINPKTLSPVKQGLGMAVAVKTCFLPNKEALQEWLAAVEFLRHNSHPNLVKLIGYSWERTKLFIVTEYFPNGSLDCHISRESRSNSFSWKTRLKISIAVAQCLAFLHSWKNTSLYRGNFSASKIMLDMEFNARVSYFGLNPPVFLEGTHVLSDEDETSLFSPPEYIISGNLHMAGDVYSFGVLLFQILTGFRTWQLMRAMLAIRNNQDNIAEMIDPNLEGSYHLEAGGRVYEVIKQCLEEDLKKRPSMQEVLDSLNLIAHI